MTERETTRLAFDVDAALLVELGERLVARRSVALAELIKNAYDADATEVLVSFDGVTGPQGSIVVIDDGSGMTLDAMKRGWMRIATDDAAVNERSRRFGRLRTGAKGVGRFACGRLASRLSLESVARTPDGWERVSADFNWHDFAHGRDLSDVTTRITREVLADEYPGGTTLRLSDLKDSWTEKDLAELSSELDNLMDLGDFGGYTRRDGGREADPGFDIQIMSPEFQKYEGAVGEPFLEAAWGLLRGRVNEQGEPQYELTIIDGDAQFHHEPEDRRMPDLAGVTFAIRMMVYQGGRFRGSGYSLAEARDVGRRRGGVRIYLDRFRVFSYGSPGDDWLDLDQDRARRLSSLDDALLAQQAVGLERPMLMLPGNMQLFGAVSLSRDRNPRLAVGTSREQLVHNSTYDQLKRFVRNGIDWMTVCYARDQQERSKPRIAVGERRSSTQALHSARQIVGREPTIPADVSRALVTALDDVETALSQEVKKQVSELSMLRILASAGTTVTVFDHTVRAMASQLDGIADRLEGHLIHVTPERKEDFRQALDDLRTWSSMAVGQGALVGLLLSPEARTRPRSLAVHPLVEQLRRGFASYTGRFGISLDNHVGRAVRTPPLYESEVYAVLLNLVTNSFKAVRAGSERRVCVDAAATSDGFTLDISDTGIGLPLQSREAVFEPFFTTSQPDPVLGVGAGLGLKIVRDLVRGWGGDASFVEPADPWHTTIRITAPNRARP